MTNRGILLALCLCFNLNLFSQSNLEFDNQTITKILYQQANDDSPGIAVGIVHDGKIVYEHYIGYANLEYKIKVDKSTAFNIASNAKQFTALCILKLADEGKLNLEDDFRKYLPDLYPNIKDKITISNLITHTSGTRDYCDLLALTGKTWWKQFIDNKDAMELLQGQKDLNFKPGTASVYSNSNYILLTEIVKKITGQKFNEFAKALFEKLEMPNTNYLTHYGEIIPNKARPYGNWGRWIEEPTITEVHGDGALYTTLPDQLQWEQIIQLNNGKYFPKKFINESQSPLASSIDNDYGYGAEFDTYKGVDYVTHDGVTTAFRATFLRFPTKNISIVLMSNNRNMRLDNLAWQIAFQLLEFNNESTVYPANPDKIENLNSIQEVLGNYKGDDGTIIKITEKDGSLYREIYRSNPRRLIPEKGGLFEYENSNGLKMNFSNIGKSNQKFTIYQSSQKPSTYHKVIGSNLDNFDKNDLNARFYNDETDTEIILKHIEGNTYTLTKNGRAREAKLILEDYLRMMDTYKIKVLRDKENKVVGLSVDNKRIRNVKFERS